MSKAHLNSETPPVGPVLQPKRLWRAGVITQSFPFSVCSWCVRLGAVWRMMVVSREHLESQLFQQMHKHELVYPCDFCSVLGVLCVRDQPRVRQQEESCFSGERRALQRSKASITCNTLLAFSRKEAFENHPPNT